MKYVRFPWNLLKVLGQDFDSQLFIKIAFNTSKSFLDLQWKENRSIGRRICLIFFFGFHSPWRTRQWLVVSRLRRCGTFWPANSAASTHFGAVAHRRCGKRAFVYMLLMKSGIVKFNEIYRYHAYAAIKRCIIIYTYAWKQQVYKPCSKTMQNV